jgi:serine/threonine protein kinase
MVIKSTDEGGKTLMAFSLSDYQILEEIGRGGFATVYRARQKSLGKEVAIKCLAPLRQQNSEQIVRFRREAETMAALTHDNIIAIIDYAFFNGSYYIVMEYIQGMALNTAFEKGLPPTPALCVMEKIVSALKAAHERNIIHRDIKPANILIGRSGQIKLADFGLAMFPGNAEFQTTAGSVLGTLCYMAPEALVSPKEVDSRVDIFALGCILYRILTGKLPFEGTTVGDISYRIMNETPSIPAAESPLSVITLRCLEKERDRRPSIDEIHRTLSETIAPQFHECSKALIAFVSHATTGTISSQDEMQPVELPNTTQGKNRSVSPFRITAVVSASLSLAVLIAAALFMMLYRHSEPDLPHLPGMISSSMESAQRTTPDKKGMKPDPDLPAPLAGTSLDLEVGSITVKNMAPNDSIFLNGRPAPVQKVGNYTQIITTPGIYRLDIRRNHLPIVSKQIDLLPYERRTIDLKNERTVNVRDSTF